MEVAIDEARLLDRSGVRITVNRDNPRGRVMYEQVGFKQTREFEGRFPSYEMVLDFEA